MNNVDKKKKPKELVINYHKFNVIGNKCSVIFFQYYLTRHNFSYKYVKIMKKIIISNENFVLLHVVSMTNVCTNTLSVKTLK